MSALEQLRVDRSHLKHVLSNDSLSPNARFIFTGLLYDIEQQILKLETAFGVQ